MASRSRSHGKDPFDELLAAYKAHKKAGNVAQMDMLKQKFLTEIQADYAKHLSKYGNALKARGAFDPKRLSLDSSMEDLVKQRRWLQQAGTDAQSPAPGAASVQQAPVLNEGDAAMERALDEQGTPSDAGVARAELAATEAPNYANPYNQLNTDAVGTATRQNQLNKAFSIPTATRPHEVQTWKPHGTGKMLGTFAPGGNQGVNATFKPTAFAQAPTALTAAQAATAGAPKDAYNAMMTPQGTLAYARPPEARNPAPPAAPFFNVGNIAEKVYSQPVAVGAPAISPPMNKAAAGRAAWSNPMAQSSAPVAPAPQAVQPPVVDPSFGYGPTNAIKEGVKKILPFFAPDMGGGKPQASTNPGTNKTGAASSTGLAFKTAMPNRPVPPQAVGPIRPGTKVPDPYEYLFA